MELSAEILHHFKVKIKPVTGFSLVWSSQGTHSQSQVSLWVPSTQSSMLQNNRVRVINYSASFYAVRLVYAWAIMPVLGL